MKIDPRDGNDLNLDFTQEYRRDAFGVEDEDESGGKVEALERSSKKGKEVDVRDVESCSIASSGACSGCPSSSDT